MAVTRSKRYTSRRRGYKVGSRPSVAVRRAGKYGLYRSTRAMVPLRAAARIVAPQRTTRFSPFPNTKIVRHKYCDVVTLAAATAGNASYYQFRCNSMYDPDYTGSGHQPMFRDEMATQYKSYTVLKSYIRFTFPAAETTAQTIQLWVDDDDSVPASINNAQEQHRMYQCVKLDKRNGPLVVKGWYDAAKWNRTTVKGLLADDGEKISVGANPSVSAVKYFTLFTAPHNSADALPAQKVHVEMLFLTMWREPQDHGGS